MTAVPKPKKSKTKSWKAKCISLSGKIAIKSGRCFRCGYIKKVDPHHIVGKAQSSIVVARVDNQVPLCRICHRYAHDNPDAFRHIVDCSRITLEAIARSGKKMDWAEEYEKLVGDAKIARVL
jgi:hypothetical protein